MKKFINIIEPIQKLILLLVSLSTLVALKSQSTEIGNAQAWVAQATNSDQLKKYLPANCTIELLNPHLDRDLFLVNCPTGVPHHILETKTKNWIKIEPSLKYKVSAVPGHSYNSELSDPQSHDQWALEYMKIQKYWNEKSYGNPNIKVAVIDTGIDYTHEDLQENLAFNTGEIPNNQIDDDHNGFIDDYYGWNAFDQNPDPMDTNKHGTHIAGVIGASTNNNMGVAGINWKVSLIPIKFFGSHDEASTESAIRAFDYAIARGTKIINVSWGGNENSPLLQKAMEECRNRGVLIVVAAGNETADNDKVPSYPGNFPLDNIISVASIDWHGDLSWFSNWGQNTVHIAAPGESILSTIYGNKYGFMEGTSMAAPQITGAAALIWSNNPNWNYLDVKKYLLEHCIESPTLKEAVQCKGYFSF